MRPGQEIAVRLENFPFTLCGAIPGAIPGVITGVLADVPRDAIAGDKRGLLQAVRMPLSRTRFAVGG